MSQAVVSAREAQRQWTQVSIAERLKVISAFRAAITAAPRGFAKHCGRDNLAESLAGEVLPLADACLYLEKRAKKILRSRKVGGKGKPQWLMGVGVELQREPFGVVLIVAPSNYPMMLPGIQALQALVAGNSVLIKPAANCSQAANALAGALYEGGLPKELLQVLPESIETVQQTVEAGVDKVVLTGSATTGRAVQRLLSETLTPSAMELSGCDAVFVTESADVELTVKCLALGLCFNSGRTCIAPRRVFVARRLLAELQTRLVAELSGRETDIAPGSITGATAAQISAAELVKAAIDDGAELLVDGLQDASPGGFVCQPTVLTNAKTSSQLLKADVFAPVMSLVGYDSIDEAISLNAECPYALGASIFGADSQATTEIANRINAGCVVVNDMIVPTADPRVPFGGRGESGFGVTRGAEGLEQMTQVKAIVRRSSRFLPHLDRPTPHDADVLAGLIKVMHAGNPGAKAMAGIALAKHTWKQRNYRKRQAAGAGEV